MFYHGANNAVDDLRVVGAGQPQFRHAAPDRLHVAGVAEFQAADARPYSVARPLISRP
jgi:hypothetical protein